MTLLFTKIIRGADYRRIISQGNKISTPSFLFFYIYHYDDIAIMCSKSQCADSIFTVSTQSMSPILLKVGIIASKKIGKAVKRNKCKRILRAVICKASSNHKIIAALKKISSIEIVVIAKVVLLQRKYDLVKREFMYCLHHLQQKTQ